MNLLMVLFMIIFKRLKTQVILLWHVRLTAAVLQYLTSAPLCVYQALDGDIVMLSAYWERRRTALTQLQQHLQCLPSFISELDAITANIGMT